MFERRRYQYVYRDFDRHGNVRHYFQRAKGQPKTRLPDDPRSDEFAARYKELRAGADEHKKISHFGVTHCFC